MKTKITKFLIITLLALLLAGASYRVLSVDFALRYLPQIELRNRASTCVMNYEPFLDEPVWRVWDSGGLLAFEDESERRAVYFLVHDCK